MYLFILNFQFPISNFQFHIQLDFHFEHLLFHAQDGYCAWKSLKEALYKLKGSRRENTSRNRSSSRADGGFSYVAATNDPEIS
ncbi:hypothetical protein PP707_04305 [Acetobacter pasteurianus]|nr:hypothetical protein [Acetobacter pasteurianus]